MKKDPKSTNDKNQKRKEQLAKKVAKEVAKESLKPKTTKQKQVQDHLVKHGFITSWIAIEKYGATRIAQHILALRKRNWNIATNDMTTKDRNGNTCVFAKYVLVSTPK
jgi:hypothetical protein